MLRGYVNGQLPQNNTGMCAYLRTPLVCFLDEDDGEGNVGVVCGVELVEVDRVCPLLECGEGLRESQGWCRFAVRFDDSQEVTLGQQNVYKYTYCSARGTG